MVNAVVPFVEAKYPAAIREPRGRVVVGFSKSGWGAFTLLLRHPDVFGRAASWDAPLMAGRGGSYKPPAIMGPPDNFAKFCVVDLLEQRAEMLRTQPARLAVFGHGIFKEDDVLAHERMTQLGIPHLWDHGVERKHGWASGWLTPAVEALVREDLAPGERPK